MKKNNFKEFYELTQEPLNKYHWQMAQFYLDMYLYLSQDTPSEEANYFERKYVLERYYYELEQFAKEAGYLE